MDYFYDTNCRCSQIATCDVKSLNVNHSRTEFLISEVQPGAQLKSTIEVKQEATRIKSNVYFLDLVDLELTNFG